MNQGCKKVFKRELIERTGVRFAERVAYEEPLFTYPLKFYVKSIAKFDTPIYYYRYNPNGTTASYLNSGQKLYEHMRVQEMVWEFLKESDCFNEFHDEIEVYFLHSFYYETECFAKARGFSIDDDMRNYMNRGVLDRGIRYKDNPYLTDQNLGELVKSLERID